MAADPHKPLRDDVRLLGELLGDTIRAQAGEAIFATVERVRALAKSARAGNDADFRVLADELSRVDVDDALPIARAFAHFLHLANIAEQHHRVRRRRAYLRDPRAAPQRGSCADAFARLLAGGIAPDRLHAGRQRAAGRAGAHRPPDRGRAPASGPEAQPHCRGAGDARPSRPHGARTGRSRGGHPARDRGGVGHERRAGTTADADRRGAQRPDRLRAEPVGRAAGRTSRGLDRALQRQHRPAAADRRRAAAVRLLDWRRPRRQPARHARRHPPCLAAVALGGGRSLPARRRSCCATSCRSTAPPTSCRRSSPAAPSPIGSCCATVRRRLTATRAWVEACLQVTDVRRTRRRRLPGGHAISPPRCACATDRSRPRVTASSPTAGSRICCGGSPRSASRWRGSTSVRTRRATRRRSPRSRRRSGLGSYADWDEPARLAFLVRELQSRRPLVPDDLDGRRRGAGRARDVPDDCRRTGGLARRLRHHDDAQRVGRAGGGAAAEGAAGGRGRCASSRSSRPSRDLQQAGAVLDTPARRAAAIATGSAAGRK